MSIGVAQSLTTSNIGSCYALLPYVFVATEAEGKCTVEMERFDKLFVGDIEMSTIVIHSSNCDVYCLKRRNRATEVLVSHPTL